VSATVISSNTGVAEHRRRFAHKQTVGGRCKNSHCSRLATAASDALQGSPSADQVVEDNDGSIAHVANQHFAADYAGAATLLAKAAVGASCNSRARAPELFGALDTPMSGETTATRS
jgi:hypothetical protein